MDKIYLQELLHGRIAFDAKKEIKPLNKFQKIEDKYLEQICANMLSDLHPINQLESPEIKKARLKLKLREETSVSTYPDQLKKAIEIIRSESLDLDKDELNQLNSDLELARQNIEILDESMILDENLQKTLKIKDESIESILKLALIKSEKLEFQNCLCLFILLSNFVSDNADYWYRAGIAAQLCELPEMALQLFTKSFQINSNDIGLKIFMIECYLNIGSNKEAIDLFEELKTENITEEKWTILFQELEDYINKIAA